MRGLGDLGIGVVSTRQVQGAATPEIIQQDSASLSNSNIGNYLANASYVNGSKGHSSALKRKRSRVANVHEFFRRKSWRRQLAKLLESTAMVSVPVTCDQLPGSSGSPLYGVTDYKTPELDSSESKKSYSPAIHNSDCTGAACENGTSVTIHDSGCEASQVSQTVKENEASDISGLIENDSSDKLFDVPFVGAIGEVKHAAGFSPSLVPCSSGKPQVGALEQQSCHVSQSEALPLGKEGQNTGCTSSAAGHNIIGHRTEKDSSDWQSKGKRNSRHISKNRKEILRKYEDTDDESGAYLAGIENSDGFSHGSGQKVDWNMLGA